VGSSLEEMTFGVDVIIEISVNIGTIRRSIAII